MPVSSATGTVEHAVIAYPSFSAGQAQVTAWRAAFDPALADDVAPHVTLVFPTTALSAETLSDTASSSAATCGPLHFRASHVMAWPEPGGDMALLFLLPEGALAALSRLHGALHAGPVAAVRRTDLPYLPHITIGRMPSADAAAECAAALSKGMEPVAGRIERISVVKRASDGLGPVTTVSEHLLSGPAAVSPLALHGPASQG